MIRFHDKTFCLLVRMYERKQIDQHKGLVPEKLENTQLVNQTDLIRT